MTRVGVYTGTFDPVHNGHILFALAAAQAGKLDRVVFIPEPRPRYKPQATAMKDRLAMLRLATKEYPNFEVAELADEQFTVARTLPQLQRQYGQISLLLGSDVAKTIPGWPNKELLFNKVNLIIGLRGKDSLAEIQNLFENERATFQCVPSPENTASSTRIRLQGNIEHLHPSIANYVTNNRLYVLASSTD